MASTSPVAATTNGSTTRPRKRAQRTQLACTSCREGKLKCSREFPACDQCFKHSREASCTYTERGLRYNASRQKAESMREKIDRLEGFVERLRGEGEGFGIRRGDGGSGRDGGVANGGGLEDVVPLAGNLTLAESGGTKYVGPSHWESIIEDIADVKAFFDLQSEPDLISSEESSPFSSSAIPQADIVQGVSSLFTKDELIGLLPSKHEVDRLVAAWFNAPEPLKLIVHAPTFQREYQGFWSDPANVLPAWLALLFAICGLGAEISGRLRKDASTLIRAEEFRRLTSHALILSDYMSKPQPYVIEAIQIQVKSLLIKHHDCTPAAWHLHGQAMRMMFLAGYHRDPGGNPAISPFECEMRRRVWMFAYEYDISVSYQVGMVVFTNRSMCNTRPPANLKEADFSPERVPPSRSEEEYTPILMHLHNVHLVETFGEFVARSHANNSAAKADLKILHDRLEGIRNGLPRILKAIPLSEAFLDPPELIFDRFRLESLYLKALCVLYRPFVGQAVESEGKTRCLDAALKLVEWQIPVLEIAQPGGQLAPHVVFLSRHVHDFNLAAMLLCYELKRSSNPVEEEPRSIQPKKVRSTVLQACALFNALGITSPKARHALKAMERFLRQPVQRPDEVVSADALSGNGIDTTPSDDWMNGDGFLNDSFSLPTSTDFDYIAPFGMQDIGAEELNIEQDPMFQDVFGPAYSASFLAPQPVLPTFKDPLT